MGEGRAAVKVQVKSCEAPLARVGTFAGEKLAHAPPPLTETLVRSTSPLLVSVTTTVTVEPICTGPVGALLVVSVVAGWMTVKVPPVLSLVVGAGFPVASVPLAAAVQEPEAVPAFKVQVKSAVAFGAR